MWDMMRNPFRAKCINDTMFIEDYVMWRHYNLIFWRSRQTLSLISQQVREDKLGYYWQYLWDLHNRRNCFDRWRKNVVDITLTDNFQYQSQFLPMRIKNDLIFLWFKVSSEIQTFSEAHIKGKMSNWQTICYYLFYKTKTTQRCLIFDFFVCRQQNIFWYKKYNCITGL